MADHDIDTSPFIGDVTILPAQFYARAQKLTPEEKLWFATLMDAIQIIQQRRTAPPRAYVIYREALMWLGDDGNHLGSFHYVCEIFDLDPDSIRRGLATANPVPRNRPTGMTANRVGGIEMSYRDRSNRRENGITSTSN